MQDVEQRPLSSSIPSDKEGMARDGARNIEVDLDIMGRWEINLMLQGVHRPMFVELERPDPLGSPAPVSQLVDLLGPCPSNQLFDPPPRSTTPPFAIDQVSPCTPFSGPIQACSTSNPSPKQSTDLLLIPPSPCRYVTSLIPLLNTHHLHPFPNPLLLLCPMFSIFLILRSRARWRSWRRSVIGRRTIIMWRRLGFGAWRNGRFAGKFGELSKGCRGDERETSLGSITERLIDEAIPELLQLVSCQPERKLTDLVRRGSLVPSHQPRQWSWEVRQCSSLMRSVRRGFVLHQDPSRRRAHPLHRVEHLEGGVSLCKAE